MKVCGRKKKLTNMQIIELRAWHEAKRELGSFKAKAKELGICQTSLCSYLRRAHKIQVK